MKRLLLIPLLLLCSVSLSQAFNCTAEERYDAEWDFDGEALYVYTSDVIEAVKNRDMEKLVSFFDGELQYGPRRSYLLRHDFFEIFSEGFRDDILRQGPMCAKNDHRGIALGGGYIWIENKGPEDFYIRSIPNWVKEERDPNLPARWKVDGRVLRPDCFVRELWSSDNFEALSEHTGLPLSGLQTDIGQYLSRLPASIPAPWGDEGEFPPLRTVAKVRECCERLPEPLSDEEADNYGKYEKGDTMFVLKEEYSEEYYWLKLVKSIPTASCQGLAPGFEGQCLESYLIQLDENYGGTMTTAMYGIYGLFLTPDGEKLIAPLHYFPSEAWALTFVEEMLGQ